MSMLDDRLGAAVHDLRAELDDLDPPPFKPNRPATPFVLALVLLVGIGVIGLVVRSRPDDTSGIVVATQPEASEVIEIPDVSPRVPNPDETEPQETEDSEPAVSASGGAPKLGQITQAGDGEFYLPIPGAEAWNTDDSRLLLYRTGAASPGHIVVKAADPGAQPVELPFTAPDIEQVYWHPFDQSVVLYAAGASLFGFDLDTRETSELHRFDGCDRVDSGSLPVPPSSSGVLSVLCHGDQGVTQVSLDLVTGTERRAPTLSDSAAVPSPAGDRFVRWNPDGTASVLDRELAETGVVLDLDDNVFEFVTDGTGSDWIAATLFDGPLVGTVVLLPLDDSREPVVLIGPERGDEYPPPGNMIAAAGSRIAVATQGPDQGFIAGNITILDIGDSVIDPDRIAIAHGSEARFDFWSNPFISLSTSGTHLVYSTDAGSAAVNSFVTPIDFLSE